MVKSLRKQLPDTFFDIHMMVSTPEQWVDDMADAGADQYTFHLEATGTYTCYNLVSISCLVHDTLVEPLSYSQALQVPSDQFVCKATSV